MELEIIPDIGFKIGREMFRWNDTKKVVRHKLKNQHKKPSTITKIKQFFDRKTNDDITQKRDIYVNCNGSKNYFFLDYDEDNKLNELEIHWGIDVYIHDIKLEFDKNIDVYLQELRSKGRKYIELEEGNYLFKKLKLVLANSEAMGGDGNNLSYAYYGKSIEHLIE